ncbi:MAG TPA: nuclear transport factor 2 family protein [Beijerinckiaceae bacterium]|jgi:ketosteroid isomerase-like protein|nr:nuclear transport factor 2 family protein [Beijerinckiaceae bacterium]
MDHGPDEQPTSAQLLTRMFEVERRFLRSDSGTADLLATAFHPDVVIHEPASLPYPGDWCGLEGVTALFRAMRETWSDIRVEDLRSARDGDTVFMACTLHLTSRATGRSIAQPFAEVLRFKGDRLVDGTPFYYDTAAVTAVLR